jgi:hypothetical protein
MCTFLDLNLTRLFALSRLFPCKLLILLGIPNNLSFVFDWFLWIWYSR